MSLDAGSESRVSYSPAKAWTYKNSVISTIVHDWVYCLCDKAVLNKYYRILRSTAGILTSMAILTQQQQPSKRQVHNKSPIGVHEKQYMTSASERAYSLIHHDSNVNGDSLMLHRSSGRLSSIKYRMKPYMGACRHQA